MCNTQQCICEEYDISAALWPLAPMCKIIHAPIDLQNCFWLLNDLKETVSIHATKLFLSRAKRGAQKPEMQKLLLQVTNFCIFLKINPMPSPLSSKIPCHTLLFFSPVLPFTYFIPHLFAARAHDGSAAAAAATAAFRIANSAASLCFCSNASRCAFNASNFSFIADLACLWLASFAFNCS